MKKLVCAILCFLLLVGCAKNGELSTDENKQNYITGVWVSYSELDDMLQQDFKTKFDMVVQNCKTRNITDMFVHVRPHCDSYYPSQYFPLRQSASAQSFDVLEYMISKCHKSGIKFHAWINPYRVKIADGDISTLADQSPAKRWLNDESVENDINVSVLDGVYLNPASSEVRTLIIDGIRELIDNYKIDGIHFDDYFYPTVETSFDEKSYKKYHDKTQKPLTLDDWRRANVNTLISGTYTAIKFKDKDIVFSISPSASIDQNYNKHYADVGAWVDSGCVDYIIPQLYFGFDYPDKEYRFNTLINAWRKELVGTNTKLVIGLATYKINTQSEADKSEWKNGVQVIKRQEAMCIQNPDISGHIYFSYTSMCDYL